MGVSDYYQSEEENEEAKYSATANEDLCIYPHELSGDEMGEQSVFVTINQNAKANFFLTLTTIIKTIIGSGILSIPYSLSRMGYLFGSIVFFVAVLLNQLGSVLLLKAKNLSKHSNYSTILYNIWPNKIGKGLASGLIVLGNIGVCIAELMIFKSTIRKILEDYLENDPILDQFYLSTYFLVLVMAVLQLPLIMVTKMEKLKFMAFTGVGGIIIFMTTMVIFFILAVLDSNPDNNPVGGMRMFPEDWFQASAAVPNFILSLTFQMNLFPIYKGMKDPRDKKLSNACFVSLTFCFFAYLLVGLLGYDYAGAKTKTNFLQSLNFETISKVIFFILNLSFLISVFFSFPLIFFSCRDNFVSIVKATFIRHEDRIQNKQQNDVSSYMILSQRNNKKKRAKIHFIVFTTILYLIIVGMALGIDNLLAVFNILGAVSSNSIGILLPCFFYFRLIQIHKCPKSWKYYLAITTFSIMIPYALFSIIALYV